MRIRRERPDDHAAIRALTEAAFGGPLEATVVDRLRAEADPVLSLVADEGRALVGHVMFSPATLPGHPGLGLMALGPMAVAPREQGKGVGSALVRAGLDACRTLGRGAVVLVGHPGYYPRFGFVPGARFGLASEFDTPPETFMVLELEPGHLRTAAGTVRFHEAFRGG